MFSLFVLFLTGWNFGLKFPTGPFYASFGFGFDPKTNDYKVIRILSLALRGSQNSQPVVEVYSLFAGEWRILSDSASLPPVCGMLRHEQHAFANGALLACFQKY